MKKSFGKFQKLLVGSIIASSILISATPTFAINFRHGDVSGDEVVDSADYSLLGKYLLGKTTSLPSPYWEMAGDVNSDGTIDSADYTIMRSYLIGKISNIPLGEPRISIAASYNEHVAGGRSDISDTTSFYISRGFIDVEYNYMANAPLGTETQTVSLYSVDNDEIYSSKTIFCPDGGSKNTRLYWEDVASGTYKLMFSNSDSDSACLVFGEIYDGSRY